MVVSVGTENAIGQLATSIIPCMIRIQQIPESEGPVQQCPGVSPTAPVEKIYQERLVLSPPYHWFYPRGVCQRNPVLAANERQEQSDPRKVGLETGSKILRFDLQDRVRPNNLIVVRPSYVFCLLRLQRVRTSRVLRVWKEPL
jgi:hypothetical protein